MVGKSYICNMRIMKDILVVVGWQVNGGGYFNRMDMGKKSVVGLIMNRGCVKAVGSKCG